MNNEPRRPLIKHLQSILLRLPIVYVCDYVFAIDLTDRLNQLVEFNFIISYMTHKSILLTVLFICIVIGVVLTDEQLINVYKINFLIHSIYLNYKLIYPTSETHGQNRLMSLVLINSLNVNFFMDLFDAKNNLIFLMVIKAYLFSLYAMGHDQSDSTGLFSAYICLYGLLIAKSLFANMDNLKTTVLDSISLFKNFGIHAYLSDRWTDVMVPRLLRVYFLFKLIVYVFDYSNQQIELNNACENVYLNEFFKFIMHLTKNFVCILTLTSIVSYLFHVLSIILKKITYLNEHEILDLSEIAAILFIILSIQSNITQIYPYNDRLFKLLRNLLLLFIAVLHFLHRLFDKQLMQLSISSFKFTCNKQINVLALTVILLFALPVFILYLLWSNVNVSTWLFAATCFNVELIIKTSVTLVIYSMFLYDSNRIKSSASVDLWINFDDYIYYIKSFGRICEFLFAILLFINSAFILVYESYGVIRSIMMCLHAYFHIYIQASKGWKEFVKRHTAVNKMKQLTIIDSTTDERGNDLCVICYYEIKNAEARETLCKHVFHSICLRKWLYIQDFCPLCHSVVYLAKQVVSETEPIAQDR